MSRAHFPHDETDPLLTTKEAANRIGVCLRTMQLWVDGGKIKAGRTPGGHRRIRLSAVLALAERGGIIQSDASPHEPAPASILAAKIIELREREMQAYRDGIYNSHNAASSRIEMLIREVEAQTLAAERQRVADAA